METRRNCVLISPAKLRALLKQSGVSQRALAQAAAIEEAIVYDWFSRNHHKPHAAWMHEKRFNKLESALYAKVPGYRREMLAPDAEPAPPPVMDAQAGGPPAEVPAPPTAPAPRKAATPPIPESEAQEDSAPAPASLWDRIISKLLAPRREVTINRLPDGSLGIYITKRRPVTIEVGDLKLTIEAPRRGPL